jgi:hypothetical protein
MQDYLPYYLVGPNLLCISTTVPSYFSYGSIALCEERQVVIIHEFQEESNANRSFKSSATLKQQNINNELLLPSSTATTTDDSSQVQSCNSYLQSQVPQIKASRLC